MPPPGFSQGRQQQHQERKPSLEDLVAQLVQAQAAQAATNKNLEMQLGQMANAIAQLNRQPGSLPSNTEPNPRAESKEHCNAVMLRSGKVLEEPKQATTVEDDIPSNLHPALPQSEQPATSEPQIATKSPTVPEKPFYPPPPFPQRLQKQKTDKHFSKFLEVLKQLHINIPLAEALEKMPKYAKFMKELCTRKRRLEDYETVALTVECSAIISQKLVVPPKLKDPGSFTIPCIIGDRFQGKALCDLGASINLMPLSIFKQLGLGEMKPTTVTLQMADRTLKRPKGMVEDILVQVENLIIPADFIVLDMTEDREIPIILGRPFLATGGTLIDVQKGELTMRVFDQQITFNVFNAMQYPNDKNECYRVNCVEDFVEDESCESEDKVEEEICTLNDLAQENKEERVAYVEKRKPEDLTFYKSSLEEPPTLEFKQLPKHLKDEIRLDTYESARLYKEKIKKWRDKKIAKRQFEPGQQVLLFNSHLRLFPGKLQSRWTGPYTVKKVYPYWGRDVVRDSSITGDVTRKKCNMMFI